MKRMKVKIKMDLIDFERIRCLLNKNIDKLEKESKKYSTPSIIMGIAKTVNNYRRISERIKRKLEKKLKQDLPE
jgi:hypothetical protein